MSEYLRTFLNEDWESVPDAPRIYVGAFGKHPGWNDHLDDIGLVTGSLVTARRLLYGAGISSQIESAAWDKLGPDKTLPAFDHVFLWTRSAETIAGLIHASRDGKGRALYPLITVAHAIGHGPDSLAGTVFPELEKAAARCREVTTADEVVSTLNAAQLALRARNGATGAGERPSCTSAWATHFAEKREPLVRLFHHLEVNDLVFAPGGEAWAEPQAPKSRTLRLPGVPGLGAVENVQVWLAFLATQLDTAVPMFGVAPREGGWVDVIVGELMPGDCLALRANPAGLPLVTDIPYHVDESLLLKLTSVFEELAMRRLPAHSVLNGDPVDDNRAASERWLARWRPGARKGIFGRLLGGSATRGLTRFLSRG